MRDELLNLRTQLAGGIAMIDNLLQSVGSDREREDVASYRTGTGGPLSEAGIKEMYRRFQAGEMDSIIARDMAISVQGVAKRRRIWGLGK